MKRIYLIALLLGMFFQVNAQLTLNANPEAVVGIDDPRVNSNDYYYWDVNTHTYPNTMSAISIVMINGEEQFNTDLEVGVFCNGECRGRQRPNVNYYSQTNHYLLFLYIYGNNGDPLEFRLYDHGLEQEVDATCLTELTFSSNNTQGNPGAPFEIVFNVVIPTYTITATASPIVGGEVFGTGDYEEGSSCTLTAMSNTGFTFANWTHDGIVVSTQPSYTFTVTEAGDYVANFIPSGGGEQLTVNDGTNTNEYVPIYGYWSDRFSKSQFIIPAEELQDMLDGTITKMTFYSSNANVSWGNARFEVYLTEVDYTSFSATSDLVDWNTMYKVRNEDALAIVNNLMEVEFDNGYEYQGGNLLVGVRETVQGSYVRSYWYGVSSSNNAIGGYENSRDLSLFGFLPKTTFDFVPADNDYCYRPANFNLTENTHNSASLAWTETGSASEWELRYKASGDNEDPGIEYGFENGTDGWTTIDADGDNHTWGLASILMGGNNGHNGVNMMCSQSYITNVGALTPDNYLVSPLIQLGGSISFWACGQDINSYAEHFGVAVSTSGNTSATSFTTIQEWTIGSTYWHQYTVDLSDYSGQGYVAIRHFNCSGQSYLNVDDIVIHEQPEWTFVQGLTQTNHVLTELEPVTTYEVQARSVCGDDNKSNWTNSLVFTTDPSCFPINIMSYSEVDAIYAVLTWSLLDEQQTAWDLQYATNSYFTQNVQLIENVDVHENYVLEGLNPQTTYYVRARGNCGNGETSEWSHYLYFTTPIACNVPTNLAVSNVSNLTAVASWTAGNQNQSAWDIQYKATDAEEWTLVEGVTETTYTFQGLEPGTSYMVQVRANCGGAYGVSVWTSSVDFVTNFCPVEDQCFINYTFYDSYGDGWNGNAIRVVDVETNIDFATLTLASGASGSGSIGLCPNRTYNFVWVNGSWTEECSFVLTDANGNELLSGNSLDLPFEFANCAVSCKRPKNLTATTVEAYSAVLTWESGEAWDLAYKVYGAETYTVIEGIDSIPYTLDSLLSETSYVVKVRGNCGESFSEWSAEYSFTTEIACNVPTNVAVSNVTDHTAVATWTAGYGSQSVWELQYKPVDAEEWTLVENLTETTCTLNELVSGTVYEVQVRANCGTVYGASNWTNSVSFITNFCPIEDQCIINYTLNDSYGDGWNGNAIQVVDVETNLTFVTLTFTNGSSASGSVGLCPDRNYNFVWVNGGYISECSFVLTDANGNEILSGNHNDLPFDFVNCDIACKRPKNLATSLLGAHTAVLTWTSGEAWDFAYKQAYTDEDFTIIENVSESTYTLNDLVPETNYVVKVRSNCGDAVSYWSDELYFTTQEACPTPYNLNYTLSYENAVISWEIGNGSPSGWNLQYRTANQSEWTLVEGLTEPTYTLTNLGNATTYYVRVRAICEDSSDWSYTISFTSYEIYSFTTVVDQDIYSMNTAIPIHGTVTNLIYGTPVVGMDVEVGITVMGWRRTLTAVTDEAGQYSVTFEPLPMESGYYTVNSGTVGNSSTAVHDAFDILGINVVESTLGDGMQIINNQWLLCNVVQNIQKTGHILIRNRNSFNLTNIQVSVLSAPAGTEFSFTPMAITALNNGYLEYTALGTILSPGNEYQEVRLKVTCDQGTEAIFTMWFYCEEAHSALEITPVAINTTMTRGASKTIDVTLTNHGQAATGEITISLPDEEWMSVVGSTTLPSIEVNESATFTLRLSPDNTVPLAQFAGNIALSSEHGEPVYLPYTILAVSEANGSLLVDVTDEFTTNTNGGNGPHVEGAEVTLTGYYSQEMVAHGYTDAEGLFSVEDLPEGYYVLNVQAYSHSTVTRNLLIEAGVANQQEVFLQYQCVTYSWVVEPTEINDEYTIVLNMEFEIEVPVPVVTIQAPQCVSVEDDSYNFTYTITNHGLIDAYNLTLHTPESTNYLFTPLYDYIDTIHANETIEIPCVVTLKSGGNNNGSEWSQSRVQYSYLSGSNMMYNQAMTYTRLGSCSVVYTYGENLPSLGGYGGAPTYGGGGGTGGSGGGGVVETPVIENQIPTVDVRVGVQFSQRLTMTREAFIGTFAVHNGHDTNALQGIGLDFVVKNELGVDCTDLFQISTMSMDGVSGIGGDGSLAAGSDGQVQILFIPTKEAAPFEPITYSFGGTFTFVDPWNSVTRVMDLYPTALEVHPSPDLYIDYFVASDVYGDNPLTAEIEPVIPAELAVRIWNKGAGTANNVILESAQPVIVSNVQGLLVDFGLYGTYIDGIGVQPGLNSIEFGNIEPGETKVGEWLFTSSLLAHTVSYDAHVIHNNSFGNPSLSLVSHVGIHKLTHPIHTFDSRSGNINDFLVDDIPDENNYPDSIFFTDGRRTSVGVVESIEFDRFVTSHDTIVTLSINPSRVGWNYGETEDPGRNRYELVSCTRNNDGQVIPLSNIWQESMLLHTGDYENDSVYVDKLRMIDTISVIQPVTYTLVFAGIPSDPYIFVGNEDENWSNAANWEENIKPYKPSSNVLIDAVCRLDEDATVSNLTITEGKSLTIEEGKSLTVSNNLENGVATGLFIEEGGQLMHSNDGVYATVKKDIAAYTDDNNGWYLIASPLAGNTAVTEVNNMLANDYDLYYYDEPTHYWINQESEENNFTELENGKGYLYANNEEVTLEFVGELQNGSAVVNVPLSYDETSGVLTGFNLVGNPFAHEVTSYASTNVAYGCYQMNEVMDDFIVSEISETNPLKPEEGFFVMALAEGASVTFNPGRGTTAASTGSIRVEVSVDNKLVDRLIVKKEGEALQKLSLNEFRTKIYATKDRQEVAIVPCKGYEQPVCFQASKNGQYTINVNVDGLEFVYLHLVDNLTGNDVNLLAESSYTFNARTTDYASRFLLRFILNDESLNESENFVYCFNDKWIIANEGEATLQVVDMLGRVLSSERINGSCEKRIQAVSGMYLIRLINGNNMRVQKVVVR